MGLIKKVGETLAGVGERVDRAGESVLSGVGYRARSGVLRSRIDSLRVPELSSTRIRTPQAGADAPKQREVRQVSPTRAPATAKAAAPETSLDLNSITFKGG